MADITEILKAFTPGAYGVWTGVLMFAGYLFREWRETRKLSLDDRNARREGYAKQVQNLQGENRLLQQDLSELREEYDTYRTTAIKQYDDYRVLCRQETDELRSQVVRLEDEVQGFKRTLDANRIATSRLIIDGSETK